MESTIIVSEHDRPFWQIPLAALCFTASLYLIYILIMHTEWSLKNKHHLLDDYAFIFSLIVAGIGFCAQKRIHIDLKNSRFRPTIEVGNFKYGKWKTIKNYQYVSVFYDPSKSESDQFEVNLWYDQNKHFELYSRNTFEDAMLIAYNLSEELNIDLLDATIRNKHEWIDKEELKQKLNE